MSSIKLFTLIFTLLVGTIVNAQSYQYLGTYDSDGVPDYLTTADIVSQSLLDDIAVSLPESFPVPDFNPQYIADSVETDIILNEEADVWVTFVNEGAGYKNVLGFYTYDTATPPTTAPDTEDITIIFPNVSKTGSGGGLNTGDKVLLGNFSANTGIGFVLIANGWNGSTYNNDGEEDTADLGGVTNGNWTVYGNPAFNPEGEEALRDHIVLLQDNNEELVVFGFEDILRNNASCDNDFNDAIFYVTANPFSAIQTEGINEITESVNNGNGVGGGNDSGLESNGDLASKVAQRNFQRTKNQYIDYNNTMSLQEYDSTAKKQKLGIATSRHTKSNSDLIDFIPTNPFGDVEAYITTPEDLLGITNAQEVFAVDYYSGNTRLAAMLATSTEGSVYDHTKTICDRFNGSTLNDIRFAYINGKAFILYTIQKPNGNLEYAVSFSVYTNTEAQRVVENHWVIEQYSAQDHYQNFQVWSIAPHYTQKIVGDILTAMGQENEVIYTDEAPAFPTVFVQNGFYKNGTLHLNIRNNEGATAFILKGSKTVTETSERNTFEETLALSGAEYQSFQIEIGGIFDLGLSLHNNHSSQIDVLYAADTPWGLDYLATGINILQYNVLPYEIIDFIAENTLILERGIEIEGSVKDYISIFKMLGIANHSVNLSTFNALQFAASGLGRVDITLTKEGINAWTNQFRTSIELTQETSDYELYFTDFTNANGEILQDVTDVLSVVFSITGNGTGFEDFALTLNNLQFTEAFATSIEATELVNIQSSLQIYPNPSENQVNICFALPEASDVSMQILNMSSQIVHQERATGFAGKNQLSFNGSGLTSGIYLCIVQFEGGQVQGKIVVK